MNINPASGLTIEGPRPKWNNKGMALLEEAGGAILPGVPGTYNVTGDVQQWLDENLNKRVFGMEEDRMLNSISTHIYLNGTVDNGWGIIIDNVFVEPWGGLHISFGPNMNGMYIVMRNVFGAVTVDARNLGSSDLDMALCTSVKLSYPENISYLIADSGTNVHIMAIGNLPGTIAVDNSSSVVIQGGNLATTRLTNLGTVWVIPPTQNLPNMKSGTGIYIDTRTNFPIDTFERRNPNGLANKRILNLAQDPLYGKYSERRTISVGSYTATEAWRTVTTETAIKGTDTNVVVWGGEITSAGADGLTFPVALRFSGGNFQNYPRIALAVTNAYLSYYYSSDQVHQAYMSSLL